MEAWKLQTLINDFTDACAADTPQIIKTCKALRRGYGRLRNTEQRQQVLEQMIPLLDDPRAHVRQCAACVVMDVPIEKFSSMPTELNIQLYDDQGLVCFEHKWVNKVPPSVQQPAWMGFVAQHMIYLEDKRNAARE